MKILYVIHTLGKGGAERQLFYLVSSMAKKHDVKVISFFHGYYESELTRLGIEVEVLNSFNYFRFKSVLTKNLQDGYDIVHTYLPYANVFTKFYFLFNAHNFGKSGKEVKLISSVRSTARGLKFNLLFLFDRLFDLASYLTIVNSYQAKNQLISRFFYRTRKIEVVYNGFNLDVDGVSDSVSKSKLFGKENLNKKVILTVANFRAQKDYKTNVKTCRELLKYRNDFVFVYVGSGPEFEVIKKQVFRLHFEKHILFLNERNDIPALLKSSDVFFLPTLFEGQCNVLIEAMYFRCPIVTTSILENAEILDSFALLSKRKDYVTMAKSIDRLLSDENLSRKMASSAYFHAKQLFGIKVMVRNTENIYKKLVKA